MSMPKQFKDPSADLEPPKKKGQGCFFYGCLTLIVLFLIVAGLGTYGIWKLKETAIGYTDTQPLRVESKRIPPERAEEIKAKITRFYEAVQKGQGSGALTLTADEVNALVNSYQRFEKLGGGVQISFQDEEIKGQVSIPLEGLPLGFGAGKYLNGTAAFKVWAEEGLVVASIDSLEVKGKKVPEMIMAELRKQNLARDLYKDVEKARMLKRLKRVEVKDGKLAIEVEPGKSTGDGTWDKSRD